jgi:serine/threonine protein kinase
MLRSLKHPHIVGLKEVFTAGTNHLAISMECCSGEEEAGDVRLEC